MYNYYPFSFLNKQQFGLFFVVLLLLSFLYLSNQMKYFNFSIIVVVIFTLFMLYNLINFLGKMSKFQTSEVIEKAKKKTLIAKYLHILKNNELNEQEKEKAFHSLMEIEDLNTEDLKNILRHMYDMRRELRDIALEKYHEKLNNE